jgi:hypothetical protein
MRRTLYFIICLALATLGCESANGPTKPTVALRTVQSATLAFDPLYRGTKIPARITNYTSDTIEIGVCQETPFILEVYRDGEWRRALPDAFDCLPWSIILPPGSTYNGTYTLLHVGRLRTGVYRLAAGIFPPGEWEPFLVTSNPFTLNVEPAPAPTP